uniref:Uncharacterized protein n=1 Tax=Knipowitschia caucasica TaxID=637954 RepID=A0AAV2K2M4_KNICA
MARPKVQRHSTITAPPSPDGKDRAPQLTPKHRPATTINTNKLSREATIPPPRTPAQSQRKKDRPLLTCFAVSVSDETNDDYPYQMNTTTIACNSRRTPTSTHTSFGTIQDQVSEEPRDPHAQNENAHYDQRDVMVIQVNSITDSRRDCPSTSTANHRSTSALAIYQQKGTYGKLYLPVTLEDQWAHDKRS